MFDPSIAFDKDYIIYLFKYKKSVQKNLIFIPSGWKCLTPPSPSTKTTWCSSPPSLASSQSNQSFTSSLVLCNVHWVQLIKHLPPLDIWPSSAPLLVRYIYLDESLKFLIVLDLHYQDRKNRWNDQNNRNSQPGLGFGIGLAYSSHHRFLHHLQARGKGLRSYSSSVSMST